MIRHPWTPEYTGSVFTSCQPLTNCDRLALYTLKRDEVPFYRVWIKPGVRHEQRNSKE